MTNKGLAWRDDPSNDDTAFERVRVRRMLDGDGSRVRDLLAQAQQLMRQRRVAAAAGALCLSDRMVWSSHGDRVAYRPAKDGMTHDETALTEAMSAALSVVGRLRQRASADKAKAALDFFAVSQTGEAFTISGCLLRRQRDALVLAPEQRNVRIVAQTCFNHLLPEPDYRLAVAMTALCGGSRLPPLPYHLHQTDAE